MRRISQCIIALPRGIKEYPAALQLSLTGDHSTGAPLIADVELDIGRCGQDVRRQRSRNLDISLGGCDGRRIHSAGDIQGTSGKFDRSGSQLAGNIRLPIGLTYRRLEMCPLGNVDRAAVVVHPGDVRRAGGFIGFTRDDVRSRTDIDGARRGDFYISRERAAGIHDRRAKVQHTECPFPSTSYMNIDGISPCRDQRRIGGTSNQCQIMTAHYGDIPTGGTEIDVLPTNAAAYRVRLVVLRTRADNEILARIRTCAGSDGYIAKNNVVGVVVVQFVNGDLSRAIFIGLRFRSGGSRVRLHRGNRIWARIHRRNRIWVRLHRRNRIWDRIYIPRSDECDLLRGGGASPLTRFYVVRSQ